MFRYSLRTLLIAITAIAVFLAIGLPWLQTSEELTLEFEFATDITHTLDIIVPVKKEAANIARRRSETRQWMTSRAFRLKPELDGQDSDSFVGEIKNFGQVRIVADYTSPSCQATYLWTHWIWERNVATSETGELNSFMRELHRVATRDYYLEDSFPPQPKPRQRSPTADTP